MHRLALAELAPAKTGFEPPTASKSDVPWVSLSRDLGEVVEKVIINDTDRQNQHTKYEVAHQLGLPRFGGEMRAWDQALWLYVMLSSSLVAFFGSTPGGAILPSRPAH